MADPNDNTEAGNNVPCNPPPNDLCPLKTVHQMIPYPPQNPPQIKDLIFENLTKLRVLQITYITIPTLTPMLSMLNTIVDNIKTLTNEQNVALR